MLNDQKIISVIPARGGSKGMPGKNIVDLNGKPLIAYTIEAALSSNSVTEVIVTSDEDAILAISKAYGATSIKRSNELASDSSPIYLAVLHVLKHLRKEGKKFDILMMLQPTSPLRDNIDIDSAMDLFFKCKAKSLISVYEPGHHPLKAFKVKKNGFLEGIVDNKSPFRNRQELPKYFYPNGAIFVIHMTEFIKRKTFFTNRMVPYVMSEEKSIDIDSAIDLNKAFLCLQKKYHMKDRIRE